MSRQPVKEQGFSTVELLISLFIAAAFIGTAFQLFTVVIEDGNGARLRSRAGGIVGETIQQYKNGVNSGPCSPPPAAVTVPIATADLPQASAVVTYSCPYGTASRTSRINVVVTYDTPQEMAEGSLDVTR